MLECLSLTSLCSLVKYLLVRPESNKVQHLKGGALQFQFQALPTNMRLGQVQTLYLITKMGILRQARVFLPGKPFQPGIKFVRRPLPTGVKITFQVLHTSFSSWPYPQTRDKARDKHSSLLQKFVNYPKLECLSLASLSSLV